MITWAVPFIYPPPTAVAAQTEIEKKKYQCHRFQARNSHDFLIALNVEKFIFHGNKLSLAHMKYNHVYRYNTIHNFDAKTIYLRSD